MKYFNITQYFKQDENGNIVENLPFPSYVNDELKQIIRNKYISFFSVVEGNGKVGYSYYGISCIERDVILSIINYVRSSSDIRIEDVVQDSMKNILDIHPEVGCGEIFASILSELEDDCEVLNLEITGAVKDCLLYRIRHQNWYSSSTDYSDIFVELKSREAYFNFLKEYQDHNEDFANILTFFASSVHSMFNSITTEDYDSNKSIFRLILSSRNLRILRVVPKHILFYFLKDMVENQESLVSLRNRLGYSPLVPFFETMDSHDIATSFLPFLPNSRDLVPALEKLKSITTEYDSKYDYYRGLDFAAVLALTEMASTGTRDEEVIKFAGEIISNTGKWYLIDRHPESLMVRARDFLPYV